VPESGPEDERVERQALDRRESRFGDRGAPAKRESHVSLHTVLFCGHNKQQ
jgi:hypothetical protein